jgi:Flp pilus assembly protein TadG
MLTLARERQRGAAMIEFHIVALFALLPLCLGTLQTALLMTDNHQIDHAAFLAARHGAVSHGDTQEMKRAFARALTPLFASSGTPLDRSNVAVRVAAAYAAASSDIAFYARVRVMTPSADAQSDFAERRNRELVIPNDSLEFRSITAGSRSGVSLQEANMLRVEFIYCRPLIVPFVAPLLLGTLRMIDRDLWHQRCYAAGRIPLRSEGVAPMQSDFRVSS